MSLIAIGLAVLSALLITPSALLSLPTDLSGKLPELLGR
jgi:hypothetical protein